MPISVASFFDERGSGSRGRGFFVGDPRFVVEPVALTVYQRRPCAGRRSLFFVPQGLPSGRLPKKSDQKKGASLGGRQRWYCPGSRSLVRP
ncbi:hypothetical protein FE789_11300 [Burkholderia pseudomallei]|nr:hypothetical protein [Burkholderia pseudomallei]PNW93069.1 hypothetical protein CF649_35355 [Burkholderia sp. 136(2017)]PNX10590.1 hypothetical protein CF650_34760 [Burkholderia sp. 129]PNX24989.1 hypothetical protein CF647_32770 [Burkholderia sp. 117]PNX30105.1 hypothetical protein CF648_34730 [Burkholderia sp. 137]